MQEAAAEENASRRQQDYDVMEQQWLSTTAAFEKVNDVHKELEERFMQQSAESQNAINELETQLIEFRTNRRVPGV